MKKMIYVVPILLTMFFVLSLFPLERKEANKWETQTIELERVFEQETNVDRYKTYEEFLEYDKKFSAWCEENGCSNEDFNQHNQNFIELLEKKGVEY